jgi:amino acid transporter
MYILLATGMYLSGFSGITLTSRVGYALARDGALPGSKWLSHINEDSKTPVRMIFVIFILASCFNLLVLVNKTAFVALTSICTIGYQISYAIPILLRHTASRNTFTPT